jgi:hypothetical protein
MSKTYKPYRSEPDLLLPPSLKDWLPEKHLAYFVSEVVDELDLSGIEAVYEQDLRGQPPYDPRMMKSSSEGFVQAYNAQIVVEPEMQLIVGQAVTQAANDKEQVAPMMAAVEAQSGQRPEAVLADSGCCSEKNLEGLASEQQPERRIEAFIATERQKHGERRVCARGPLPKGATWVERMKRKLLTKAGAAIYAARKGIVEPVFGQIKEARGFRRFSLRGLEKVKAEWALVCATHNILKMYRACYG